METYYTTGTGLSPCGPALFSALSSNTHGLSTVIAQAVLGATHVGGHLPYLTEHLCESFCAAQFM